jgi:hypothetical protein
MRPVRGTVSPGPYRQADRLRSVPVVRPPDTAVRPGVAGAVGGVAADVTRPVARGRRARRWGLLLIAGWLVQAGLRAWLGRGQAVPLATPDESAYLIAARVLAGGVAANFSYSTLYPAGYPLLITPVYWFTSDPVTVYHAVLLINAAVSAVVMPLGYLACRRLHLDRPAAFGVAMVAALLPAALFYSEFALTDAIYPVIVLGWLLATHSWLTARSVRAQYAAAAGSALLTGYAYAVHSRGAVMVAGYVLVGALVVWRRLAPRGTALAAAVALCLPLGAGWLLNRYLSWTMYPSGPRTLAGEALIRLHSVHGAVFVLEMAAGQLWRFVLDGWGVAALGLAAAIVVVFWRGARDEVRIMAGLAAGVTLATAVVSPAALPPTQPQAWASGRYLDGMVVAFFLVGASVLLRADRRLIIVGAACVVPPTLLAAIVVAAYTAGSVPTAGFGAAFVFAEPAVLTQDWTTASVWGATAAAFGLLAAWVAAVLAADRWGGRQAQHWRAVALAGLAAVSLVAVVQMTSHISQASTPGQRASTIGLITGSGLKPGERLAVGEQADAHGVSYTAWMPQAYEIPWAQVEFFNPAAQPPPANATVVEVTWPSGPPQASWPRAPAGWRVVASDRAENWVAWRKLDP